jgi:hypothetical protein
MSGNPGQSTVEVLVDDINDSEILAIEKGPWAYMRSKQKNRMELEDFRRTVIDKFAEIGFKADVVAYTSNVPDVYIFEVVVRERLRGDFDPDRQVHEVVNNILELPDQNEGWIDTDAALKQAEQHMRDSPHRH